jgi:hypothetical protein
MNILFLHGWTSKPGGVKPTYLADHGHEVINPALPDDDFAEAVRIAQAAIDAHRPDVIVGSSRGGAVAMNVRADTTPLVLLCPAWRKYGTAKAVKPGTVVLHSRADDVIPFADSEELVGASGLPDTALIEVGHDHRLADPEPLSAMLAACLATRPRVIGCDFGVPKKAGDQAKKIILVEAVRLGERHYVIETNGRNARLASNHHNSAPWKGRRGWTLPDLADSLCADRSVKVAAFDFPFSIPNALLHDGNFAQEMGQAPFGDRAAWAQFVAARLRLAFDNDSLDAELHDLDNFAPWRNKTYWVRRSTDKATNGSPPLKHKFQNVFAMTLAGAALLDRLGAHGYTTLLDSATPAAPSCVIETYPRAVARRIGHTGSYKAAPEKCLARAEAFLKERGIRLDFDVSVRRFCETYRTSGSDPDGADAFLCLVAAIACSEGMAEMCDGQAAKTVLREEGAIVVPTSAPVEPEMV